MKCNEVYAEIVFSREIERYSGSTQGEKEGEEMDERLRLIDPKMVELIRNEIMDVGSPITWNDIAGLHYACLLYTSRCV